MIVKALLKAEFNANVFSDTLGDKLSFGYFGEAGS